MGDIKSAYEIAMQKVDKIGEPTEEEIMRWKYVPIGEKLAGKYMNNDANLYKELSEYEGNIRTCILETIQDILITNINLVKNDEANRTNKRAMEGLKQIKEDKIELENIFSQMRSLFEHDIEVGDKQREQAYESIKQQFIQRMRMMAQKQYGKTSENMPFDVDNNPQFLQEMRRVIAQIDSQYMNQLDIFKKQIKELK